MGGIVGRAVEADDVTGGGQLLQRQIGHAPLRLFFQRAPVRGVVAHFRPKGPQQPRHGLGDMAEAHQAHPAVPQLPQGRGDHPAQNAVGGAGIHTLLARDQAPCQRQHQKDGLLRHGGGVGAGIVAYIDAPLPGGLQLHLVKAHALALDQLEVGHGVHEDGGGAAHGVHAHHLCLRRGGGKDLVTEAALAKDHLHLLGNGKVRQILLIAGLKARDQDFHGVPLSLLGLSVASWAP